MTDVLQKCIAANAFKNNGILVHVNQLGGKESTTRGIEQVIASGAIVEKYTDRFDDPDPVGPT